MNCVKIVQMIGRGFYLSWARGFPCKNRVFIISTDFYPLLCQDSLSEQAYRLFAKIWQYLKKTQFAPLLCFVLSNLTVIIYFFLV